MTEMQKQAIIKEAEIMSYAIIAERYGITRGQVAGIIWRHKNPVDVRVTKPGYTSRNWCGRGDHGPGPYPRFTVQNSR